MNVETVLGPVDVNELGVVLPHEHIFCDLYRITRRSSEGLSDVESVTADVAQFHEDGGGTIIDVTPPDLGRRPDILRRVSVESGVNIIMGSGWYREPFYDRRVWETPTQQLAEELIHEITHGVDGIRPGIIGEIGADGASITPVEERAHRAAARAHLATGLPITTHAFRTAVGLEQLDLLEEEGVDPRRVVIGHCDSYSPDEHHLQIARRGACLGIDLIRGLRPPETKRQVRMILGLIDRGLSRQILLSHDVCFHEHLTAYGGHGYSFILGEFSERLEAAGMSRAEITQLIVDNPRSLFLG